MACAPNVSYNICSISQPFTCTLGKLRATPRSVVESNHDVELEIHIMSSQTNGLFTGTACLLPLGRIEMRYLRQFHVSYRGTLLNFRRRFTYATPQAPRPVAPGDRLTKSLMLFCVCVSVMLHYMYASVVVTP